MKHEPTVILMCGLAFSGKTSLARVIVAELGCGYVSLDEINARRGLCGGDGLPAEEWEHSHRIAVQDVEREIASGKSVVVDDTNCFRWLRDRFRAVSRANGGRTTVVLVDTPIHEIEARIARNRETAGRKGIRPAVLSTHEAAFERPAADEEVLVYDPTEEPRVWIGKHFRKHQGGG